MPKAKTEQAELERRRKISKTMIENDITKGKNNPRYGKYHSKKTKQKIGNSLKGSIPWNKGKIGIYSEKVLEKNREVHKGLILSKKCKEKISRAVSGKNHHNWQGGIGKLPYSWGFNNQLKKEIRERDSYQCQFCGKFGKCIHHINYNKKDCKRKKLINLCVGHNVEANYSREKWELCFTVLNELRGI